MSHPETKLRATKKKPFGSSNDNNNNSFSTLSADLAMLSTSALTKPTTLPNTDCQVNLVGALGLEAPQASKASTAEKLPLSKALSESAAFRRSTGNMG